MKRLATLSFLGIPAALVLYFCAASLYPGGTKSHPTAQGYSHFDNYWCDLLDVTTYSGAPNPGRPYALAATVLLPLSLIPFWFYLPLLFGSGRPRRALAVQGGGCLAMLGATLIFTPAHDSVIIATAPFAFAALVASQWGLFAAKQWASLLLLWCAFPFVAANFIMWRTGLGLSWMPMVQKGAFLSVFAWVLWTTWLIGRKGDGATPR